MTRQEIFTELWTITKEKHAACLSEIAAVDQSHPTERAALQIKAGIYNVAIAAGLISGGDQAICLMSKRFQKLIKDFPDIADHYASLPTDQKAIMEVALYPEVFMRSNFYHTYIEDVKQAEKEGDPQAIFKTRIKKDFLGEILNMWREFRVQNNLFIFAFDKEDMS